MGDMQVGVATIDDKAVASLNPSLQASVSFGRFENDSLSWEKFSAFSENKYLEEAGKCATPGSVAQKKAYFEAHYKKIAVRKAEIMDQEKQMDKNASFRSIVSDQGSVECENGGLVAESEVDDGSNGLSTCDEDMHVTESAVEVNELSVDEVDDGSNGLLTCVEDMHVTDIAVEVNELSVDEVNEETIIVKDCESSEDQVKEEVKDSEKSEDISLVEKWSSMSWKKPEEVLQVEDVSVTEVREEPRDEISLKNDTEDTKEKEVKKATKHNLMKKNDGNVRINPTRSSPKPSQVMRKPEPNKTVPSRKTPPSKEIRNLMKTTKKPAAAPISKAPQGFSNPRVYKPYSQKTSLSTSSQSLLKKENSSALLKKKQTAPKSLHISMNLDPPPSSNPSALPSTRKSLIMERMGDKDIVKRAFKTFRKSFDFTTPVEGDNMALKQNTGRANPPKEMGRLTKASITEKRSGITTHRSPAHGLKSNETTEKPQKELSKSGARHVEKASLQKTTKAGVIDSKTRRDSLNPKAKPKQGSSLPVRILPKSTLDKVLR